jgi:hypothetical protein
MDIGEELTRVTLGIDRLYRSQAGGSGVLDREGLIPVILTDVAPIQLVDWNEAEARLVELDGRIETAGDAMRLAYLEEMIDSLRGLIATFRGDPQNYVERVQGCLRVDASGASTVLMDQYRDDIDRLLRKAGYVAGTMAERVMRWEEDHQVAPESVPAVLKDLLEAAHERTVQKMFPLPDGLVMDPVGVRGVPFSAYCDYVGRQLRINLDYVYTRSSLKHLACHEAFPGHLVHLAVRERLTKAGQMPLDAALVVTSSASSALFEGIGENGIAFLDWIEDDADILGMTLNRLRSAARMNAALLIHQNRRPLGEVRAYLRETCFATPAWVESRLAFLTHPLRAPFIFAYWCGDRAVEQVWNRTAPHQRSAFFQYLYHHMHTVTTLDRYWPIRAQE